MAIWILSLMQLLVPRAPYADTFATTAAVIDKLAHEWPLYDDEAGIAATAAELVSVAFHESTFNPRAIGGGGSSVGIAQIDLSNRRELGVTREELFDPETNLRAALKLMHDSHRFCRRLPREERLANYSAGGTRCSVPEAQAASRMRMRLAAYLLRVRPVRWVESVESVGSVGSVPSVGSVEGVEALP